MSRLLPATLAALAFAVPSLHAQAISIYGTFSDIHASNVANGTDTSTSSYWAPGFGGGVTFGVIPIGPIRLGFDLRGSSKPGTPGVDTGLAGIKLGVKIPFVALKPYVQASGGYIATSAKTSTSSGSQKGVGYEILAGADIPIAPFFDFRALEIGAGKAYGIPDIGGGPNPTLFSVSTGLVFRF